MDQSSKIGPGALERSHASQAPLTSVQVAGVRGLVAAFPLVAVVVAIVHGVSGGRLVEATFLFAAIVVAQLLLLSPARRRQVLGRPADEG